MEARSFLRGQDKTHGHASIKYESLSRFFVDTITGPYKQDISFLLVGKKGTGKSYSTLSLGYHCGINLAEKLGGHWTDYFNPEENIASIDPIRANELMSNMGKYQVKIFDDISIGWGARNWQDEENKAKNDVATINRISSQIAIYSLPSQWMLDKIPRSLVSHYGETYQQFFRLGFVTLKVFEPQILHRMGKIIQPHLVANRSKYVIYQIPAPPPDVAKAYDKIREEATIRIATEKMDQIMNGGKKDDQGPKENHFTSKMYERIKGISPKIEERILIGMEPKAAAFEVAKEEHIPIETMRRWIKQGRFMAVGVPLQ